MKHLWGVFLAVVAACVLAPSARAGTFYPYSKWRTINTSHFSIHFHQEQEPMAQKAAGYFEEAFEKLSPQFRWRPWGKTQVVLSDNYDEANGMAGTLPYNWILLRIVPPSPAGSLSDYDNWLRTLILHEYTHILHLDAYGGFWTPLHYILGKLVAPAAMTPGWNREGIATLEETDETLGGRGRSAYSEMLVRTAILNNHFPPIDQAAGVHWKWPGPQTQYIFGVKFLQYLEERFGKDKLLAFERMTQRSFWIGAVNHDAKKVFGKSMYTLWREWRQELKEKYAQWMADVAREGLTPTEGFISGKDSYALPTFSRDGKKMAYASFSPRHAPIIWVKDLETGKTKKFKGKAPEQMTFSPDGQSLVFSTVAVHKRYYLYYDLFKIDLENGKQKQLTHGERARDPDFSPDGKTIVFAASRNGTDAIKTFNVETKEIVMLSGDVEESTQFADLRYSPDGSKIALVRFNNHVGWELYVYKSDGTVLKRLTHNSLTVEANPVWSADGKTLVYSSDEDGVYNLYAVDVQTEARRRLTRVTTGVFEPALSPDGATLLAKYYNGGGWDVRRVPFENREMGEKKLRFDRLTASGSITTGLSTVRPEPVEGRTSGEQSLPSKKYFPFGTSLFLPRYVLPGFQFLSDGVLLTAMAGGTDPLHHHNWSAGPTYRSGAGYVGYFGSYYYNRWLPVTGFGIQDFAVDYGTLRFTTGNAYHFYEKRRNSYAFMGIPLGTRQGIGAGYFYEDRNAVTKILASEAAALNLGVFAGVNLTYQYGEKISFPASISHPEKGRNLKLNVTLTDARLLAAEKNEQQIYSGDYREYIPLGRNYVFAIRAAAGVANGDAVFPGTFTLGGDLGEGVLAGAGYARYFSLRGLPVASFDRNRVALFSGEFRMPLVSPQRGLGTWPLFLNNLHLALFGDYGDAWNANQTGRDTLSTFFDQFMLGVGTELRADMVIWHGLPLTGRLGYGIIATNRRRLGTLTDNVTGKSVRNGTIILQFGTSF